MMLSSMFTKMLPGSGVGVRNKDIMNNVFGARVVSRLAGVP